MSALPQRIEHSGIAVSSTLTSPITNSDTALAAALLTGWPTGSTGKFYAIIGRGTATEEKVLVTTRSGNNLSGMTRGVDGTSASAHASGEVIEHVFVAAEADAASAHMSSATSVHGVDGAVVGTTQTQTLTGKTLDGGANTFQNIPQSAITNLVANLASINSSLTTLGNGITSLEAQTPVGMVVPFAGASAPSGWALCDGSAVSRSANPTLWSLLGTTFGAGDGSTTFNLPNLKGKSVFGLDAGQTEFDVRGETGGAKTVTLTASQIPSHTHGTGANTSGAQSVDHSHSFTTNTDGTHNTNAFIGVLGAFANSTQSSPGQVIGGVADTRVNQVIPTSASGSAHAHSGSTGGVSAGHTHSIPAMTTDGGTGGGQAHSILPPYMALNFIILLG